MVEKNKYAPERMCASCRVHHPKDQLIRIAKDKDGNFVIDEKGKAQGRGAYLCLEPVCFEKTLKTRALNKSFKCSVPQEIYDRLKEIQCERKQNVI